MIIERKDGLWRVEDGSDRLSGMITFIGWDRIVAALRASGDLRSSENVDLIHVDSDGRGVTVRIARNRRTS